MIDRPAPVVVSGRGDPLQAAVGMQHDPPADLFLENMMALTQLAQVVFAGGAVVLPGLDVVDLAGGRRSATARVAAFAVAGADEPGQPGGGPVCAAAIVEQGARDRVGEEPSPGAVGVGGDLAGDG